MVNKASSVEMHSGSTRFTLKIRMGIGLSLSVTLALFVGCLVGRHVILVMSDFKLLVGTSSWATCLLRFCNATKKKKSRKESAGYRQQWLVELSNWALLG